MTVGDGDKPTEDFQRGFTAGYQHRLREEAETYVKAITAGQQVYDSVIKGLINVPTFAEREEKRLATIKLAHDAGVHGHSARGCPWCEGVGGRVANDGTNAPVPNCRAHGQPMMPGLRDRETGRVEWRCVCSPLYGAMVVPDAKYRNPGGAGTDMAALRNQGPVLAHNGDYGAPDDQPDVMARARRARGGRGEVDAPLGKFAQAVPAIDIICSCQHSLGAHGVNGCTATDVSHEDQIVHCPCWKTDDIVRSHYGAAAEADPCAGGCSDPERHAEGGHDV